MEARTSAIDMTTERTVVVVVMPGAGALPAFALPLPAVQVLSMVIFCRTLVTYMGVGQSVGWYTGGEVIQTYRRTCFTGFCCMPVGNVVASMVVVMTMVYGMSMALCIGVSHGTTLMIDDIWMNL